MFDTVNKGYKRFRKEAIEHIKCHSADTLIVYYNPEDRLLMSEYIYLLEEDIKDVEISGFSSPFVEKGVPMMMAKRSKEEDKLVYGEFMPHLNIDPKETVSDMFLKRLRKMYGVRDVENNEES